MRLKTLELNGFKSFSKKTVLEFSHPIVCVVGPNGSGKSNVVEAIRFVLGEQSMKSMRGKLGADLIFKGSQKLPKGSRASVTIYFDNQNKAFKLSNDAGEPVNLNFDTVSLSREVYPDGLNKYILNGSEVRLRDINNLLASVNIGSSGHHIISQGEADRILSANPKERREMVEDALGLKIYQYRIRDSLRKLEKTEANMKEVSMLRRENAPHLNFLKKQMEKLEKAKEMQTELATLYREYLKKESVYLENEKKILSTEKEKLTSENKKISAQLSDIPEDNSKVGGEKIAELRSTEEKINETRKLKNEMGHKLGRIEGMIEIEEERQSQEPKALILSREEVKSILDEINNSIDAAMGKENIGEIRTILQQIKLILDKFNKKEERQGDMFSLEALKKNQKEIADEIKKIEEGELKLSKAVEALKLAINREMESLRDKEKEKFSLKVRQQELSSALELLQMREANVSKGEELFQNEIREGQALIGEAIVSYKEFQIEGKIEEANQVETRKKIERLKIKLEDAGAGGGGEILKEFREVSERDAFLAKEMGDLEKSVTNLEEIISGLKEKVDQDFEAGVKKINKEFAEFFSILFGGGTASLNILEERKRQEPIFDEEGEVEEKEEEDAPSEKGIEIKVSLPHKKVKELQALSGGERSLTSIALLFAMSQVNPPPFLVLDETDAALDEANSRKYGDMLEKLSKHSQLIVVTHNRETMSRAGMLYGVTIGPDSASKLLSVRFEEAVVIAK
ncbi:hypothetical protein A3I95_03275 [Candidatus Nomurabacteria bacterium RIFCSPLOWO2_02_FULL_44_12]|nr:MAG: hypothetical protein A3E95_03005 [Candidatus Nomurabacteria bacterium RIFCSPHIGHO2_12_FULL_44_22b]OGJ07619.1 MAG: hypothetical protein A3I95_03275 [Candidatus Nomurabacteria bacterium RIFCSPLOWO2_02_FULL_44_12]